MRINLNNENSVSGDGYKLDHVDAVLRPETVHLVTLSKINEVGGTLAHDYLEFDHAGFEALATWYLRERGFLVTKETGYQIFLTQAEVNSLVAIGRCYNSAEILAHGLEPVEHREDGTLYRFPEHVAWEYLEALPGDWSFSDPDECPFLVPPLAGGTLAEKLEKVFDEVI